MRRSLNPDFKCVHCRAHVVADPFFSGVQHRNHCPYCLWSRHLDHQKAGDRLSACKAGMRPIGLTYKRIRKKYGDQRGEMMLVHLCMDCGKISLNRVAADDDSEMLAILMTIPATSVLDVEIGIPNFNINQDLPFHPRFVSVGQPAM
jgi:DNA-directed RNA polymerase subunit RPC12/RpoP